MIYPEKKYLQGYTFIDLFAGIGGFRVSLESFGGKCVYSSEWDKHCQIVYKKNFGETPDGDITKVDEKTIPDHDILCGGFPCQAFSISGKQRGFEDTRGTLFFDIVRIVKEKKPKVVFMENVKNLTQHDGGRTLQVISETMKELGYSFNYKVLCSSDYGVPQQRDRVYMVCFRNDLDIRPFHFPEPIPLKKHLEDVLLDDSLIPNKYIINREDTYWNDKDDSTYTNKPRQIGKINKGGQGERIYSIKGTSITLSAYGGGIFSKTGGYLINGKTRKLHPRECCRLMGFPDSFQMSDSDQQCFKQFGNSVTVDVLQYITQEICYSLRLFDSQIELNF